MSYRITVPRKQTETVLDFDGSNFLLHAPFQKDSWIHELAAGSWDKKESIWKLPPYILYANTVLEQLPDVTISEAASNALVASRRSASNFADVVLELKLFAPRAAQIYHELFYSYQREAADWLIAGPKDSGLIALSPGLGKTIVTLLAAKLLGLQRVLIIAPRPLLRTWENEQLKFFSELFTTRRQGMPPPEDVFGWVLTNYETVVGAAEKPEKSQKGVKAPEKVVRGYATEYMEVDWDLVVLDESVLVKSRDSRRFKILERLRKTFKSRKRWWELSGSPVTRYYDDLWAQLHLIDPAGFHSYWRFTNRYCYVVQDVWGSQITGSRLNLNIRDDLKDVVFIRNQEEVLPDLPEEIPMLVEVALAGKQLKAYDEMATDFCTRLDSGKEIKADYIIGQLTRLQQITSNLVNLPGGTDESAKADALLAMIEARSFEFPAIVWTHWKPGAHALTTRISTWSQKHKDRIRVEWIHGAETELEDRDNEEIFENYKAGGIDILVLSIDVGKFGHNLQNTRTAAYIDKTFDADAYVQSMKRIKRIGLDHSPVVITFKDPRTVDQLVEDNLSGKFPGIAGITASNLAAMLRHLRGGA